MAIVFAISSTSCVSYVAQNRARNDIREARAIESGNPDAIRVAQARGDLKDIDADLEPGLIDAYRERPWLMAGAGIVDIAALGYLGYRISDSGGSSSSRSDRNGDTIATDGGSATNINLSGSTGEGNITINVGQQSQRDTNNFIEPESPESPESPE